MKNECDWPSVCGGTAALRCRSWNVDEKFPIETIWFLRPDLSNCVLLELTVGCSLRATRRTARSSKMFSQTDLAILVLIDLVKNAARSRWHDRSAPSRFLSHEEKATCLLCGGDELVPAAMQSEKSKCCTSRGFVSWMQRSCSQW